MRVCEWPEGPWLHSSTQPLSWPGMALLGPTSSRQGERFQVHSELGNRRLLWHGTNVAVVAAILTSGLRIMPHSGGRVGKGIYFASENSKSAGYGEAPAALRWACVGTQSRTGPSGAPLGVDPRE